VTRKVENYIGVKYNRLTIVREIENPEPKRPAVWVIARCNCGVEKPLRLERIINFAVLSCGCGYRENKRRYRNAWEIGPPKRKSGVENGTSETTRNA